MSFKDTFEKIDQNITCYLEACGPALLRYSLAIVFIWFGMLKVYNVSPAHDLVIKTVYFFDPSWFYPLLGWWEVVIGICLLYKPAIRLGLLLMAGQMVGTFLPLVILPEVTWAALPLTLTIEGQYIVKNLVLIAAAIVVGSNVRKTKSCSWISPFNYNWK